VQTADDLYTGNEGVPVAAGTDAGTYNTGITEVTAGMGNPDDNALDFITAGHAGQEDPSDMPSAETAKTGRLLTGALGRTGRELTAAPGGEPAAVPGRELSAVSGLELSAVSGRELTAAPGQEGSAGQSSSVQNADGQPEAQRPGGNTFTPSEEDLQGISVHRETEEEKKGSKSSGPSSAVRKAASYVPPTFTLLERGKSGKNEETERELKETAYRLQETLRTFGVQVTITDISQGPSVTRYEL
jgi:DNA segregation ATPase FtsK/SpoIIIE-like protein